jgi:hypothetical protein
LKSFCRHDAGDRATERHRLSDFVFENQRQFPRAYEYCARDSILLVISCAYIDHSGSALVIK